MEILGILFFGLIFFKQIVKIIRSFVRFFTNILFLLILKIVFEVPFSVSIFFIFCFKYMSSYINKKVKLSVQRYKKYRKESDCLKLRKIVRLLFECNYIAFLVNCFMHISEVILKQSLWYSAEFIIKAYLILLIVNLIKRGIDSIPEKYYA